MDLKIVSKIESDDDRYLCQLNAALSDVNPLLSTADIWNQDLVLSCIETDNTFIGRSPIDFSLLPPLPKAELKYYWLNLLRDKRNSSKSVVEKRRLPMKTLCDHWRTVEEHFTCRSISEIPHPEFPMEWTPNSPRTRYHNKVLLSLFSSLIGAKYQDGIKSYPKASGTFANKKFLSPKITIIGDIHKCIVINKERLKPFRDRNLFYLNELYSESDSRFADRQRGERYLNFFLFPSWMRPAAKGHLLQKIEFGELGPATVRGHMGRFICFRDFMHEKFKIPSTNLITPTLIEDDYIAWGNKKGLTGRNWYTDVVAMLNCAAQMFPDEWPPLSLSPRAPRKIENVHYKYGLGRIGHNDKCAERYYSKRIVNDIAHHIEEAPHPVPLIFLLISVVGMRAEDGHAILFDCLSPDPIDRRFMVFRFWQNKVSRWNEKPLLIEDELHSYLIERIEEQRSRVLRKCGNPTKYLFPKFTGTHEGFPSYAWTRDEIKRICISNNILDDAGAVLNFSWHPLRHSKGTSMAEAGHDILLIMMELGHASPDMATVYVNNRLQLKKKALLEKGGGKFFTIEGKVDEKIGELLVKKELLSATRVCGGACTLPNQLGDWCSHAHACYSCKHFRADSNDVEYFIAEKAEILDIITTQSDEIADYKEYGRLRMADITGRRQQKNKEVVSNLSKIIEAVTHDGIYKGSASMQLKMEIVNDR